MNKIQLIYNKLYKGFGPQHWWPTKTRWEIIIGAILTQNTSWKNVEKAIAALKKQNMISINKIKNIKQNKLAELIKPSGYYNQKAERLKLAAEFFSKNKSPSREQLLSLKGIGPETADSILLYAFNTPVFVVDAYTKRIFSRLAIAKSDSKPAADCTDYNELQDLFHNSLPKEPKLYNEYHALIVKLGKDFCTKTPDCTNCPISSCCNNSK